MSVASAILSQFSDTEAVRDAIDRYFYQDNLTGARFEDVIDSANPDRFTALDIVAVSMLSVNIPPPVSLWLLYDEGAKLTSDLLSRIPNDLDIWEAEEHITEGGALWDLWDLLHKQKGIKNTKCSKLLAAKRPRLVPIMDSVVEAVLGPGKDYWKDFREALSSPDDRARIAAATANAPQHVSLLRRIDVVIWMLNRERARMR